jgi:hypothetical protein
LRSQQNPRRTVMQPVAFSIGEVFILALLVIALLRRARG